MRSWPFSSRALLLLAALSLTAFWPLLNADFIYWDDHALLTANPAVLNFEWRDFLFNLKVGGLFPLTLLSLAIQNQISGLDPFAYHILNLVLHAANGGLVYLCATKLFGLDRGLALTAAALFLAHPLRVEPVAWISGGRKDLLCAFFYLAALLSYRRAYPLALILFTLALLSKAMAVTFPVALLLLLKIRREPVTRREIVKLAPFAALALAAAALEMIGQRTGEVLASQAESPIEGVFNVFRALAFSAAKTFAPQKLAIFYEPGAFRFSGADFVGLGLAGLFLSALAYRRFRGWWTLALFLLLAAPVLKLVPFGQTSVFNDRYLYLPGAALAIFLAMGFAFLFKRNLAWLAVPPLMLVSYAQAKTWRSQESVWLNVLDHYPETVKAYQNLSLYYIENKMHARALEVTERAVRARPEDMATKLNLGVLYSRMERYADAERAFLEVLKVEPRNPVAHHNLAFVYAKAGMKREAAARYREALNVDPGFTPAAQALKELESHGADAAPGTTNSGSPAKK